MHILCNLKCFMCIQKALNKIPTVNLQTYYELIVDFLVLMSVKQCDCSIVNGWRLTKNKLICFNKKCQSMEL